MQTLLNKFLAFSETHKLLSKKKRVLVAVSGGLDSMALCHLMLKAKFTFAIAHCNFKLRGNESDEDEAFVKDFAAANKIEFYSIQFDTKSFAESHKLSIQEAARKLRYNWFSKLLTEKKIDSIVTAHHLNDNIETVLFNLSRGTGIKGLRGILPKQEKLLRPLLFATREALEYFAKQENIHWREDSSNSSDKYSRNFIRHKIVPLFKEINPSFEQTFAENIAVFTEVENLFENHFKKISKTLIFKRHNDYYISIEKLKSLVDKRSILFTFLKDFDFNTQQIDNILENLNGQAGAIYTSEIARIIRDRRFLILTKGKEENASAHFIKEATQEVNTAQFSLNIETVNKLPNSLKTTPQNILVNKEILQFPLVLRKWKAGDYFYPFGFNLKKKKVKKFLTDLKLPLHEKENVWVIESNKKIVWVVGLRADERFKVNAKNSILKFSIIPNENTVG